MRIPHRVIVKAPGLLPMHYKISELAEELGVPDRTLRDWLNKGAPHKRDSRQNLWINGEEFAVWVDSQRQSKVKPKLDDNYAYCFRCKKEVEWVEQNTVPKTGKLVHIQGKCPECGCTITRGGRDG